MKINRVAVQLISLEKNKYYFCNIDLQGHKDTDCTAEEEFA